MIQGLRLTPRPYGQVYFGLDRKIFYIDKDKSCVEPISSMLQTIQIAGETFELQYFRDTKVAIRKMRNADTIITCSTTIKENDGHSVVKAAQK